MAKHFLAIKDYSSDELKKMLDLTVELKQLYRDGGRDTTLAGKSIIMIFEKPSSRTRLSFTVGVTQLGGSVIYVRPEDFGGLIGEREPIKDLTRVLNGYVDMIISRTFSHDTILELAKYATVPVINALTDLSHPCQAMADILTIQEHCGTLAGKKVVYVGDGNNVAMSLGMACVKMGLNFSLASPEGYTVPDNFLTRLKKAGESQEVIATNDPFEAVKDADVIYTDTWTSMGQEEEKQKRIAAFGDYQVNQKLLDAAGGDAKIMHCLPAYRDLEITDEVIESPHSIVFDQAENRLHFQRALMKYLIEN